MIALRLQVGPFAFVARLGWADDVDVRPEDDPGRELAGGAGAILEPDDVDGLEAPPFGFGFRLGLR